jgi:DNA repair exonuclease SbcCD ATPase subunit
MEHLLSQLSSSQKEVDKFAALLEGHSPETDTTLLDAQLKEIDTDLGVNRTKLFDVRASLGSGVCPTCKRPYEHDAGWLANLEAEEKVLMQEAADLQKERTRVARDVEAGHLNNESLRKVKERLAAAEHTRDSLLAERDASEKRIKLLSDEGPDNRLAEIRATAKKHQDEVNHLSTQATELATAMAQKADIEERLGMMSARIQVLGPAQDEPDTRPLEEAITALKAELAELNQLYTPKSHDYTRLSGEHNTLSSMMITAHEQMEKRAKLESRLTVATALAKYLRGNRDRFMSTVWAGIMSQASSFTAACTGGDVTRVDRDEKGNFTYEEGGHVLPVQAASGAQRSIMGLGVQLALATMLPCPLATILLDEPSADADDEVSLALTSMLTTVSDQLIIVSHRAFDNAVAENVISLEK